MDQRPIDLHCHSTFSDGTLTPTQLVAEATRAGLAALALTDHDTFDGWPELEAAARDAPLEVIPGVELSTRHPFPGSRERRLDLLCYGFDPAAPEFGERLAELRARRTRRNAAMAERLRGLGLDVSLEEATAEAGAGGVVGRPHFARVMLRKGYIATLAEAFEKYIGDDGPGHVQKENLTTIEAITLASRAGARCAIAHPGELRITSFDTWRAVLAPMVDAGLAGIEALYAEHRPEQVRFFRDLADAFGLVATGGSDFHGANRPGVRLGVGRGNLLVPYEVLRELKAWRVAA